jgi:FMN phosphatase YigB (HAD superfamily)
VDRAEADRLRRHYWLRYGATLLGLVRHHGIDPHHFLHETHDFEVAELLRAERGLGQLFARLPGRKVLLTNAPARYASAVVRALAIHRHLGAHTRSRRCACTAPSDPSRRAACCVTCWRAKACREARPFWSRTAPPTCAPRARSAFAPCW